MKNVKLFGLLILGSLMFAIGCNDDDEDPDPQPTPVSDVNFDFEYRVGSETFQAGQTYTLDGVDVKFDRAYFYIGGIKMENAAGDMVEQKDKYIIVTEPGSYSIGEFTAGDYTGGEFFVGVAPEENSQSEDDFTSRPDDDPLAMQDPSMHWNWNAGYRFLRVDGQIDTDGDGTFETVLQYHIGRDQYLVNLSYDKAVTLAEGANSVEFVFDFAGLFDGIDLSVEHETHTIISDDPAKDETELVEAVIANYPKAFLIK